MPKGGGGFPTTAAVGASGIGVQAGISNVGNVPAHILDPAAGIHTGNLPITLKVAAFDAEPVGARGAYSHCDGVADEVQINAAIAIAAALGHGIRVELSDGHFYTAASIITRSWIKIKGAGIATTIVVPAGANFPIFTSSPLADLYGATVRSLYIDGVTNGGPAAMAPGNDGLRLCRCQGVVVEDVLVNGVGSTGFSAPTAPVDIYSNWINRCSFNNCWDGVVIRQGRFNVAYIEAGNLGGMGIGLANSPRSIISNNFVHDATQAGIWLLFIALNSDNCVIKGNIVVDNDSHGIKLDQASECIIKGNQIKNNGGRGIRIDDAVCARNIVKGNVVIGNVGDQISDMGTDSLIRHNIGHITENKGTGTIVNPATAAVIAHGLSVTPAAEDIIITLKENPTNDPGNIWIDTIGAVNFTVHCRNDPGVSNLDFAWQVQVL